MNPVITFVFVITCDVKHIMHIKQFSISSIHRLERTIKLDPVMKWYDHANLHSSIGIGGVYNFLTYIQNVWLVWSVQCHNVKSFVDLICLLDFRGCDIHVYKHNIHSSNCHNFILSLYLLLDTLRNFGERWECNRANDRHYSTSSPEI
jgi:hypothetical protein